MPGFKNRLAINPADQIDDAGQKGDLARELHQAVALRGREDQNPAGCEQQAQPIDDARRVRDMLEYFAAEDQVETRLRQSRFRDVVGNQAQIRVAAEQRPRVVNMRLIEVRRDHLAVALGQGGQVNAGAEAG